jgi:tRNA(adenine34) deaminase
MRRAGEKLACEDLRGAVLYTTLQPCGMCTMASIWAKIGRIVYGAGREDVHPMYFEDRHLDTVDFIRDTFRRDLSLAGGLMVGECAALYVGPYADVPQRSRSIGKSNAGVVVSPIQSLSRLTAEDSR